MLRQTLWHDEREDGREMGRELWREFYLTIPDSNSLWTHFATEICCSLLDLLSLASAAAF